MSTEWIKFVKATFAKPEVLELAAGLGVCEEEVIGRLLRVWSWADDHLTNGDVSVTLASLDRVAGVQGFGAALLRVRWLRDSEGLLTFANFEKHNGETAKARGQSAKRSLAYRVTQSSLNERDKEKKRIKRDKSLSPAGNLSTQFLTFWSAYPQRRRVDRARCWDAWRASKLDILVADIVRHVEAMKLTPQWRENDGRYVPLVLTYLNQRRWESGMPERKVPSAYG